MFGDSILLLKAGGSILRLHTRLLEMTNETPSGKAHVVALSGLNSIRLAYMST